MEIRMNTGELYSRYPIPQLCKESRTTRVPTDVDLKNHLFEYSPFL